MPSVFWFVVAVVGVVIYFGQRFVYRKIVAIFNLSSKEGRWFFKILLIILGLSFVIANILASLYNNAFTRVFYTISASWYGIIFYLFLATAVFQILNIIFHHAHFVKSIGKVLVFVALLVIGYGLWNAQNIVITNYDVSLPNLPKLWQDKKIVFISDVHLDQVHNVEYSQKIVDIINAEKPDIVFIGGDLYDGVKIDEMASIAPFKKLKPKLGVYFVTGNHEEFGDNENYLKAIKAVGIKVLNNEKIEVYGLNIVGVDDHDSKDSKTFENILTKLDLQKDLPTILLKHEPIGLDIAEKFGVDLQISGHTHKGQIWPLSYFTNWFYKGYDSGKKSYGKMQIITSDGVGTWGPPLRVGSKSEILVLRFR